MEIKKEIFNILKKRTSSKLSEDTTLENVGIDSLDFIEVILEIEDFFSIKIPDEKLNDIKTLSSLIELVSELKK